MALTMIGLTERTPIVEILEILPRGLNPGSGWWLCHLKARAEKGARCRVEESGSRSQLLVSRTNSDIDRDVS